MLLDSVRFRYPGATRDALGPIDLEGPADRPWLLLGPSGSGKTTLLRLLAGQLVPTAGRLAPRLEDAAYLPQFPEQVLAGRNLAEDLCGAVRPPAHQRARLRAALAAAGLHGKPLSSRNQDLSGGERRQVAHALLALAGRAHWALDEPDAGLDRTGVDRLLADLTMRGAFPERRLWLASHRFELYGALNPLVLVLAGGRLLMQGDLRHVLAMPEVHQVLGLSDWPPGAVWARYSGMGAQDLFSMPLQDEGSLQIEVRKHLLSRVGIRSERDKGRGSKC